MQRLLVTPIVLALVTSVSGCGAVLGAVGLDNSAEVCDQLDTTASDMLGVVFLAATNPLAFDVYAEELTSQADALAQIRPTDPALREALLEVETQVTELLDIIANPNETATLGELASTVATTQLAISGLNSLCESARQ